MKRSWENAGLRGILVVMLLVSYLFRGWLVENLESVCTAMNAVAIVTVLVAVILRRFVPSEPPSLAIAIVAFMGAYLGCYFWLLSDELVVSLR